MRRAVGLLAALIACMMIGGAKAEPWRIARESSSIVLSVRAFGATSEGRFEDWRGDIVADSNAPDRTRATVVVQTASLRLRPTWATARATGPEFLDAARHPTIRFHLRSLEPLGSGRYTAQADATLKGVTRPVTFPVDLRVTGDRAQMTGGFTVDRTAFGIGTSGPWNNFISRQVTVRVSLAARRA